jgi:hypothetical protein
MSNGTIKKKEKKTFIVTATVNGKLVGTKHVTFTDEKGTGFEGAAFACALLKTEQRLREELLKLKWEEKKK